jgi:hypothetical protein
MRRSGSEWASTCLATYGSAGSACNINFPGNTRNSAVPENVPSLVCPNTQDCDDSLGRVEWHAENKFARKCTLDQWALVWSWIQTRAGAAAPPDCDVNTAAPRFWGVYSCYEQYFVHPLMIDMLNKLRDYAAPNPPMTPACQGRCRPHMVRAGARLDPHGQRHLSRQLPRCRSGGRLHTGTRSPMIDEATSTPGATTSPPSCARSTKASAPRAASRTERRRPLAARLDRDGRPKTKDERPKTKVFRPSSFIAHSTPPLRFNLI